MLAVRIDHTVFSLLSFYDSSRICLQRLGVVQESDHIALVVRVFWRYIQVMRVLQSSYWLEPAGSHGVWGLDDYHFLPFLFGSAQLRGNVPAYDNYDTVLTYIIGHKYIRPKSIHDADVVDEYSKYYMYLACIKFINSVSHTLLPGYSSNDRIKRSRQHLCVGTPQC